LALPVALLGLPVLGAEVGAEPGPAASGGAMFARAVFPAELLERIQKLGHQEYADNDEVKLQVLPAAERAALLERLGSRTAPAPKILRQPPIFLGKNEQKKEGVSGRVAVYMDVSREGGVAEVYVDEYARPELARAAALACKLIQFAPSDHESLFHEIFDLDSVALTSGPGEKVANPALRDELLRRRDQDQEIRNELIRSGWDHPDEALSARMRAIDQDDEARMGEILKQYGWPGPALVGKDATFAAWLLVQHSTAEMQRLALPLVRSAYKDGELPGSCYALLLDRVLVGQGRPQVYGSQAKGFGEWKGHEPELDPIEDEANVDKRRAEVGLGPLSEYIKSLKSAYFPNG
jgi:uncharacterized protein DUF6624